MATHRTFTQAHFAPRSARRAPVRAGWVMLTAMLRARRTRRLLAEMDDRMLADIGVDRGQAHMESARAFWDVQPRR
jgi:uncharacterized protein YjiS (DUF1127 family)